MEARRYARTWSALSFDEKNRISAYADQPDADDLIEIEAERLQLNPKTLRVQINIWRRHAKEFQAALGVKLAAQIPTMNERIYNDQQILKTDDAIIISDVEIPHASTTVLKLALLTGIRHGIRNIVWGGDVIATDQAALNEWVRTWREMQDDMLYSTALGLTKRTFKAFGQWYNVQKVVEGNHDDRVARRTGGEVHLGMFLDDLEEVEYSRYGYMWIKTRFGYGLIAHPRQYSEDSVKLGRRIYNKTVAPDGNKPRYVIVAHTHQPQEGRSTDGLAQIVGLGCTRSLARTQYINQGVNTYAVWGQGFAMMKNGYLRPLVVKDLDWQDFLGDLWTPQLGKEIAECN